MMVAKTLGAAICGLGVWLFMGQLLLADGTIATVVMTGQRQRARLEPAFEIAANEPK